MAAIDAMAAALDRMYIDFVSCDTRRINEERGRTLQRNRNGDANDEHYELLRSSRRSHRRGRHHNDCKLIKRLK